MTMGRSNFHVAIVGAGLSGLALALALDQQSINCTIYEARDSPLNIGGALMLTPNGLKVLNRLGIYKSLCKKGFNFDCIYLQDTGSGSIIETYEYGNQERYGFRALRVYRHILLQELLAKVQEKSIPIHFNHRFAKVVSETEEDVAWEFANGNKATASLLVGADGIHSTVRKHVAPGIKPTFVSMAAIVAAIPTAQLELPAGDLADLNAESNVQPLPAGIVVPKMGAFVIAPQTFDGDEVMITVQRHMAPREHWADLNADKEALRTLLRQNTEHYPPIVRNAVRDIPSAQLYVWPFYQIPRLERWTSAQVPGGHGRVVILGDSAHALPPPAGQGVNQAFEDIYMVALMLGLLYAKTASGGSVSSTDPQQLQHVLYAWQSFRQARIDRVLNLNRQMDLRRLPAEPGAENRETEEGRVSMNPDFDWLFKIDFDAAVAECMESMGREMQDGNTMSGGSN